MAARVRIPYGLPRIPGQRHSTSNGDDLVADAAGVLDAEQLTDYLRGGRDVSDTEHNVVTHALNEVFQASDENHPLAYRPL